MERWNSRVALVTGASRGIGAAICTALVKYGITVVGCSKNVQMVEELAQKKAIVASPGKLHPVKCDLANEDEVRYMFQDIHKIYGRINLLVNNASWRSLTLLTKGKRRTWSKQIRVNLIGTWQCTEEALKMMRKDRTEEAAIIQICRIDDRIFMSPLTNFYNSTVITNLQVMKQLRDDLKVTNSHIKIFTLCSSQVVGIPKKPTPTMANLRRIENLATSLKPEDIVDCIIYFLTNPAISADVSIKCIPRNIVDVIREYFPRLGK